MSSVPDCGGRCFQEFRADVQRSFEDVSARIASVERQLKEMTGLLRSLGATNQQPPASVAKRKPRWNRKSKPKKVGGVVDSVPSEIWEHIFRCLPVEEVMKVRLVCRRWKQVIDGCSTLTEGIDIYIPKDVVVDQDFKADFMPPMKGMVFFLNDIKSVNLWWPLICQRLERLQLIICKISKTILLEMLQQATKLKSLQLNLSISGINDESVEVVRLELLEDLSISGDEILNKLICPSLKKLKLIDGQELPFLLTVKNTLKELTAHCSLETIDTLLQLKHLIKLDLTFSEVLTVSTFYLSEIGKVNPHLKSLKISTTARDSEMYVPLDLEYLNQFTDLEYFSASGAFLIPDEICFNYFDNPALKELHLERFLFLDDELEQGLNKLPNIRRLSLDTCRLLNGNSFFAATQLRREQLQNISLFNIAAVFIEDATFELKTYKCLRYLHMSYVQMPKQMFIELFRACPNVEKVFLFGMKSIDDEVLSSLLLNMKLVKYLVVANCDITDISVDNIINNCKNLKQFAIGSCTGLTDNCRKQLEAIKIHDESLHHKFKFI